MLIKNLAIKNCNAQKGGALIIMVVILLLAGTTVLFSKLNASGVKIERDKKTTMALATAKAALIGWSAGHDTMPGALPCPDTSNSGSSGVCTGTAGIIGRLPWKTLGLSDLRDGDGECLWYALSPLYRDTIATGSRGGVNSINSNIPGTITVKGVVDIALPNSVIAVIIAPSTPLAGQARNSSSSTVCGGNTTASNYLDAAQGVNNSTGNVSVSNYTFIAAASSSTFNDRLIYITAKEFYMAVRKRIANEILGTNSIHAGPAKYYDTFGTYPFPSTTVAGNSTPLLTKSFVNNSAKGMGLQYANLGSWLDNNGWYALASYTYTSANHVNLTLADALGSYSCDAKANVFTCTSP